MLFVENNTERQRLGVCGMWWVALAVGVRGGWGLIVILGFLDFLDLLGFLEEYIENASVL